MHINKNVLLILVLVLYGFFFIPVFDWDITIKAIGALLIVQVLWIGRVFPLSFSSLILILILSFHFFSYEETLSYFGSGLVWLLFAVFILSHAFIKTGLAGRVALYILSFAKGSGRLLIFVSFVMAFILTFFIPSNLGKGTLISSILDDILKKLNNVQPVKNIGKAFFIGIVYVCAIAAAFVPTGASSTIYAFGMFQTVSDKMTYFHWMIYFGLPIFLFVFLLWLLFQWKFPVEKINAFTVKDLIDSKLQELGKWDVREVKMAFIIVFTLILWLTEPLHGYSIPLIGLVGAVLTIIPYIGVFDWSEAKKGVNWDMMIFFAATLMLSNMLVDTGVIDGLATYLVDHAAGYPSFFLIVGLVIFTALIRVVFVNVLGFLTIMLPLAITLGEQIPGIAPLTLAMAVYLAGVPGFLLITQSPVHLISYGYGYFTNKDLFRVGIIAMLIWIALVIATIFVYWKIII